MIESNSIVCDDCGKVEPYNSEFNSLTLTRTKISINHEGSILRNSTVCHACVKKYENPTNDSMYTDLLYCLSILTASVHTRNTSDEELRNLDDIRKRINNLTQTKRYEV